jgi:dienelactone hydrolase
VPTRHGEIAARLYAPAAGPGPLLAVFPGVHGGGVDEPRLVALSRRIAAAGATVLSVPLPDLRRYRLTTRATDMIEDVVLWMPDAQALAPRRRVGLVGVSFAGGLALVAAGRPALDGRITAVFALGAHADLPRVIRYLCTADEAPKTLPPPHDYGVALMLRNSLPLVVPADQVEPLDRAITAYLDASSADATDRALATRLASEARAAEATLPEPARSLLHAVNTRDVAALGRVLAPYAEDIGGAPALSPVRSPATRAPVFLLHGDQDNVIPTSELPALAAHLAARDGARVETYVTGLLTHADARADVSVGDAWRLVRFWTRMWAAFEAP